MPQSGAMSSHKSFARVISISVPDTFDSSKDDSLTAKVEIENTSNFTHSAQVIFRGYIRKGDALVYEFLHEQVWLLVEASSVRTYDVVVDVWLPKFPPTMVLNNGKQVDYAVRATVDPWFSNHHVEKTFSVRRTLTLKMPHVACLPKKYTVNQCVGHGGWMHKKCNPLNGNITIEKGAFAPGEMIHVKWMLRNDESSVDHVKCNLQKTTEARTSDPGHYMAIQPYVALVSTETVKSPQTECMLPVPRDSIITMAMTLWNVLIVKYDVVVQVKLANQKNYVDFTYPVIVCNEPIKAVAQRKGQPKENLFSRATDIDDDSSDDDDFDSDDDEESENRQYSLDIEKLKVVSGSTMKGLQDAYAEVEFVVNSTVSRPLRGLRLLLLGEVRAGSNWYEFLRFKAIANTDSRSEMSPGRHSLKFALPFHESQYDVNILAPTLGDDVRYVCRATAVCWRKNVVTAETDILVDRFVDTWAKETYKPPYEEQKGAVRIALKQRCFQRGKFIIVKVEGSMKKLELHLVQQQRLRIPGLHKDDSYCHERVAADQISGAEPSSEWPSEWGIPIPNNIPPSIEISYWNVLVINYELDIIVTLEDGHVHNHRIPIWIGCTDDKLAPLESRTPAVPPIQQRASSPEMGELPEFEVVHPEETQYQPYWVERFNDNTYGYMS